MLTIIMDPAQVRFVFEGDRLVEIITPVTFQLAIVEVEVAIVP